MKEFYSIMEVAKIAGVSRMTVYNWVKQGKLKWEEATLFLQNL